MKKKQDKGTRNEHENIKVWKRDGAGKEKENEVEKKTVNEQ